MNRKDEEKMGGVIHRVTCIWWLLWKAIETAWLGLSKPVLALVAQMGLQTLLTTFGCEGDLGSEWMFAG